MTEPELVRHFVNLSTQNMSVDTHFYPLGSCTMKYNPKRNERAGLAAGASGASSVPAEETIQGMLAILYALQEMLAEISGLDAVSLQPAAGAHGEMTALLVAAAYLRDTRSETRKVVLIPDGAHGTNPASAAMAGFTTVEVKSTSSGLVDLDDLRVEARRPDGGVHDHQSQHAGDSSSGRSARSPRWFTGRAGWSTWTART